jgi:hypothetical protein
MRIGVDRVRARRCQPPDRPTRLFQREIMMSRVSARAARCFVAAMRSLTLAAAVAASVASCSSPPSQQPGATSPARTSAHAVTATAPAVSLTPSLPAASIPHAGPSHWTEPMVIVNQQVNTPIVAISCPSLPTCYAIDQGGNIDASRAFNSWTTVSSDLNDGSVLNRGISCVSSSFCVAVGGFNGVDILNGDTWDSPSPAISNDLDDVSCVTTSYCVAVSSGGDAYLYRGSPSNWIETPVDPQGGALNQGSLTSVSCPAVDDCIAAAEYGHLYSFNGTSWSQILDVDLNSPGAPGTYVESTSVEVSCSSREFCMALEDGGQYAVLTDGEWSTHSMDTDASSVTCPVDGYCMALDGGKRALIYHGGIWSRATVNGPKFYGAMNCPTIATCAVAGNMSDNSSDIINGVTYYIPTGMS